MSYILHTLCMSGRRIVLATGEYYHVYNRGIARQPVFFAKRNYERFLLALAYYRAKKPPIKLSRYLQITQEKKLTLFHDLTQKGNQLVEIICYTLMPNHFHLLVQQLEDRGISTFMSKTVNSYTRYVNTKHKRVGDLFQGVFKAVHVETDEQLVHVSRYIHLNPVISYLIKSEQLETYPWSSFQEYLGKNSSFLNKQSVLHHFSSKEAYRRFVFDQVDYGKTLENIKHLVFD